MILRETIKRIFFWIFALTSHVTYSPVCSNCFLMRCSDYAEFTPLQMKASWKPIWSFYLQTLHPPPHPFAALTYSQLDNHFFANALLITQNLTLFYFVYMNIFHKIVESPSQTNLPVTALKRIVEQALMRAPLSTASLGNSGPAFPWPV